jgi:hypothetical protein
MGKITTIRVCVVCVALLALYCTLPLSTACYRPPDHVVDTIIDYIAAVQGQDIGRLYQLRSGLKPPPDIRPGLPHVTAIWEDRPFPPSGNPAFDLLRERAQLAYHLYDKGRERGSLRFSPLGIVLIKGLVLGRGVMYSVARRIDHADGRVTAYLQVDLNYEQINYQELPQGTIVYFMGYPLGATHPATVGQRLVGAVKLLDRLQVRVDLAPAGPPAVHGWRVTSFSPQWGSDEYITVTGQIGNRSWLRE